MSIFFEILVRIASYGPQIDQSHGENRLSHITRRSYVFNEVRVRADTNIHVRIMLSPFQALLSPPPPPRVHLSRICHLVGPGGGQLVRKPLPGGGAVINSSRKG